MSEIDEMRGARIPSVIGAALRKRSATINSEVGTLKHVLKEGRKCGAIHAIPEAERIRQAPRSVEILIEAEMVRLIEAAPPRLRALLAFLAETGCRKGEVLNLTWDSG